MHKLLVMFVILSVSLPAVAATGRGRASMANQMDARVSVTQKQIGGIVATNSVVSEDAATEDVAQDESIVESEQVIEEKAKDMREREKAACIQNNIGVGATFVWASKYSNSADYNSMIEDVEFPENNVCFVKVGIKSNDSRIDVSDIPTKYFVMGENITCGQWTNADKLKSRILDAKKKGRTWATVGGVVGGAGVGVGAMELFGNKLIGGAVEGQANEKLTSTELLCSQMKVLKQEKPSKYNEIIGALKEMQKYCEDTSLWTDTAKPETCKEFDYKELLKC